MARDTVPAGDVGRVRRGAGRALRAAARRARGRRGRGRRRARAPVGGDGRRARRGRAVAADRRPARRGSRRTRSTSCAACSRSSAPTTSPARGDELMAAGRTDEAGELYRRAAETRARLGRAAVLVRPRPRAGRRPRGRRRRGPASGRGEPELAGPPRPALTGVRAGRRGRASADHLKLERGVRVGDASRDTVIWVFAAPATDGQRLRRGARRRRRWTSRRRRPC